MIPGSGNSLVEEPEPKKILPCGCCKRCSCDDDDEVLDEYYMEKIKDISIDIKK